MSAPNSSQQIEGSTQRPHHAYVDALKAHNKYPPKDPVLKPLWDRSRWLARVINPFNGVEECFFVAEGGETDTGPQAENALNRLSRHKRAALKQQKEDWNRIKRHIPNAVNEVIDAGSEIVTVFFKFVQASINAARGDDTKDLKPVVLELIPQRYLPGPTNEAGEKSIWTSIMRSAQHSKSTRGFANNITARLLCPVDHIKAFDANPSQTIEKLKNGSLPRLDRDGVPKFPLFMYDEDMLEPGKVTNGLFRGPLLVAVYEFIFVSKRVAKGEEKTARRGIAEINQMGSIEPVTICYAVLQTWVGISDMSEWAKIDHGTDLSMLYTAMRHLLDFERGKDPWVDATLDWWDSQVIRGTTAEARASRDSEAPSTLEILDIERRQRMAATQ